MNQRIAMTKRQAELWTSKPDLHADDSSPSYLRNTLFDMSQDFLYLLRLYEAKERELEKLKNRWRAAPSDGSEAKAGG